MSSTFIMFALFLAFNSLVFVHSRQAVSTVLPINDNVQKELNSMSTNLTEFITQRIKTTLAQTPLNILNGLFTDNKDVISTRLQDFMENSYKSMIENIWNSDAKNLAKNIFLQILIQMNERLGAAVS